LRDSVVDPSVAKSDPKVQTLIPGSSGATIVQEGNMPCDQTLTTAPADSGFPGSSYPGTCEVFELELNQDPNSGFATTNVLIETPANFPESTPNLRVLRNLDADGTDVVVNYPAGTCLPGQRNCNSVYTVNQQSSVANALSCGFQSPAQGQTFTKTAGSSIPFKFTATSGSPQDCQHGPFITDTTSPTINPLLLISRLNPPFAPTSEQVIVKGKSGGPPTFVFSGNTWQLQVNTTNLDAGFSYVATVVDLLNVMPSFSVTFSLI
jgi:hypothetical protein